MTLAGLALAQTPAKKIEFEVASIRPAENDNHQSVHRDRGRFTTHNLTLKRLVALAYDLDVKQVSGGPNWVDSDSYDINAKIPDAIAGKTEVPDMVQSLLAERFHLAVRRETREVPGFVLVPGKKGTRLTPATQSEDSSMHTNNAEMKAQGISMDEFAKRLGRILEKPVADRTGLTGTFDFELKWSTERLDAKPDADTGPSIFTAIQEQLGLKLESAKIQQLSVAIEHAEKPDAN